MKALFQFLLSNANQPVLLIVLALEEQRSVIVMKVVKMVADVNENHPVLQVIMANQVVTVVEAAAVVMIVNQVLSVRVEEAIVVVDTLEADAAAEVAAVVIIHLKNIVTRKNARNEIVTERTANTVKKDTITTDMEEDIMAIQVIQIATQEDEVGVEQATANQDVIMEEEEETMNLDVEVAQTMTVDMEVAQKARNAMKQTNPTNLLQSHQKTKAVNCMIFQIPMKIHVMKMMI